MQGDFVYFVGGGGGMCVMRQETTYFFGHISYVGPFSRTHCIYTYDVEVHLNRVSINVYAVVIIHNITKAPGTCRFLKYRSYFCQLQSACFQFRI
jgi:hypothetical protein